DSGRHLTFQIPQLSTLPLGPSGLHWMIFGAFLLAMAIKAPLWPFHGWMPDVYGKAPAPITAMVAGVLSKAGIYGMMRLMVPLFGQEMHAIAGALLIWATIDLVYGGLIALRQNDVKMITAYASLSHMGMMALGVFTLTQAGLLGALFEMVAHGLMVAGLFIVLGILEQRTGTRNLSELGGINQSAPRLTAYTLFFVLAILGLPGLPGFVGEYLILQGLIVAHQWVIAGVAGISIVLASWYMIRLFQGGFQGPSPLRRQAVGDLSRLQVSAIVPLAAIVLLLGVWPAAVTQMSAPSLYAAMHFIPGKGGIGV
ncbi:MAG: NADH-quinone oxidoreductase subunit M, partial [Firmicutes bacterium]|nr:NADH-quinone oxidoreductase subunit M [Bacillota bacterium]